MRPMANGPDILMVLDKRPSTTKSDGSSIKWSLVTNSSHKLKAIWFTSTRYMANTIDKIVYD